MNILDFNLSNSANIDSLLAEADKLRNINAQKTLELCKDAADLSIKIDYKKGLAKANYISGVASRLLSDFERSFEYFNDSIIIYRQIEDKRGVSRVLNSIGNVYMSLGNCAKAVENFDECIYTLQGMGDLQFEATVLANKALAYQQDGDLIASLENNLQSLAVLKSINRTIPHTLLNNIGVIYLEIGNFQVALKYFNDALQTEEESGNLLDESSTLANIGRTFIYMDDCTNAIAYLNEALTKIKKYGSRQSESQLYSNLGKAYLKLRCFPESISYFNKALSGYKELGDNSSESHTLAELGEVYLQLNDYKEAKKYFDEGLVKAVENSDELNEVRNYTGLAGYYIKLMDLESANKCITRAIGLAEERRSYKELSRIFRLLSDGYLSAGDTNESMKNLKLHFDYMKKLIQLEEENSLKMFTASYKFNSGSEIAAIKMVKKFDKPDDGYGKAPGEDKLKNLEELKLHEQEKAIENVSENIERKETGYKHPLKNPLNPSDE